MSDKKIISIRVSDQEKKKLSEMAAVYHIPLSTFIKLYLLHPESLCLEVRKKLFL